MRTLRLYMALNDVRASDCIAVRPRVYKTLSNCSAGMTASAWSEVVFGRCQGRACFPESRPQPFLLYETNFSDFYRNDCLPQAGLAAETRTFRTSS